MNLKTIAAAVISLAAASAMAAPTATALVGQNGAAPSLALQTGNEGDAFALGTLDASWTSLFVTLSGSGSFFNTADFTVPANSGVNASANTYALTFGPFVIGSIGGFDVKVWDNTHPNGLNMFADLSAGSNVTLNLTPGQYHLDMTGFVNGAAGQYSVGLQAAPVPEPETYALMLAGLGAVGFVARRRKAS
jgi:hypothetical protein